MDIRRTAARRITAIATALMLAFLPLARPAAMERRNIASKQAIAELPDIVANLERARQAIDARGRGLDGLLAQPLLSSSEKDKLRRVRARLDKALVYIKIAHASGATRHELIRQLPVTIAVTRTVVDGRLGSTREYVANGKVRVKLFVPDAAATSRPDSVERDLEQPADSAAVRHGSSTDCFYEDEDGAFGGPCATQQEVDDALIVEADLAAGEEQMVEDADAAHEEMEEWCAQHYPACGEGAALSGPSATEDEGVSECPTSGPLQCIAAGIAAVQQAGYAVASRVKLYNLANSPAILTISAGALAWKVFLAVGSVGAAVIFIGAAWECLMELRLEGEMPGLSRRSNHLR